MHGGGIVQGGPPPGWLFVDPFVDCCASIRGGLSMMKCTTFQSLVEVMMARPVVYVHKHRYISLLWLHSVCFIRALVICRYQIHKFGYQTAHIFYAILPNLQPNSTLLIRLLEGIHMGWFVALDILPTRIFLSHEKVLPVLPPSIDLCNDAMYFKVEKRTDWMIVIDMVLRTRTYC